MGGRGIGKRSSIKLALCFYKKGPGRKFYDVIMASSKIRIVFKQKKSSILIFKTLHNINLKGFSPGPWKTRKFTASFLLAF